MFAAGDRGFSYPSTSQSQRTSPPHHMKATDAAPSVQRSRAPLPSQAEAMRYSSLKKPQYTPMDIDVDESLKFSNSEQAPIGPKAGKPRGKLYAIPLRPLSSNAVAVQEEGEANLPALAHSKETMPDQKRVSLRPLEVIVNPQV